MGKKEVPTVVKFTSELVKGFAGEDVKSSDGFTMYRGTEIRPSGQVFEQEPLVLFFWVDIQTGEAAPIRAVSPSAIWQYSQTNREILLIV